MHRPSRRLRPVAALVASVALVMAAGASATPQERRSLRVGTIGEGMITSADGRIQCGRRCAARFKAGARVTLTARPGRHFSFQRWTGGCVGTVPSCIVVLDRATITRAVFSRNEGFVELAVSGRGTVVSDPPGIVCGSAGAACSAEFSEGLPITLTPSPNADNSFAVWGGACAQASSASCRLSVEDGDQITAAFRPDVRSPDRTSLFVTVEEGARVVSDPPGIDCPTTCFAEFPSGTLVTLRAFNLLQWGLACVGGANECVLVMDESTGVRASNNPPAAPPSRFGLNVSVSGRGFVSGESIRCGSATGRLLDCESLFRRGSIVILRAVPKPRARFAGWGGFCSGKRPRCTVRVTAAKTVLAAFRR
jgi:hypothetical protein